ncbi:MAG: ROK family protein [Ruminococcaceae bacterium]|nr:ROK family protein [Oscillospiraceae bacterium]
MNCKKILCIDAGGTFFKYGVYRQDGERVTDVMQVPSRSDGSKEEILASYRRIILDVEEQVGFDAIGISTPGPFDYATGTSGMKHKYAAIYGVSLKEEFGAFTSKPVFFVSDTNAFLLGEYTGEVCKYQNVLGVTIGTGLGLSVIYGGALLKGPTGGVAEVIYNLPYGDGIAEDAVSARGIVATYGKEISAKEVAMAAFDGDRTAREVYCRMGVALGTVLKESIKKYHAELILIGGQVAKSIELFGDAVEKTANIKVLPARSFEEAALRGISNEYFNYYGKSV